MMPRLAYVVLWFPKPSETFVFDEVIALRRLGVPLRVFTLYGRRVRGLSADMLDSGAPVETAGLALLARLVGDWGGWRRSNPDIVRRLWRTVPFRSWGGWERTGENVWAFLYGFHLARRCVANGIQHIHAPWAGGPATAAWCASRLTGLPFSFSAHAADIYPPDGALEEKIRASAFVRSENRHNIPHLQRQAADQAAKFHVIHNGHRVQVGEPAAVPMTPPFRILALGRLVRKKGFDVLLRAAALLKARGLDFRLLIAGSGPMELPLRALTRRLGLAHQVEFPGFLTRDRVPAFLRAGDVLVMPSVVMPSGDRDGIPNVILEALLHRLPVVATDVGGITEVIQDGETGWVVPPRDPGALAGALGRVLGRRAMALEVAERGRQRVTRDFNLETCCLDLRRLFELAAAPGPSPGDRHG